MGTNNTYQIPFVGLKDGVHLKEFVITDQFFASFDSTSISNCNLVAKVTLIKVDQNNMTLSFSFEGWIRVICDRCMVSLKEPIIESYQVQVKLTEDENLLSTDEVDILYLNSNSTTLDLDQLFYEYLHLLMRSAATNCICSYIQRCCNPG